MSFKTYQEARQDAQTKANETGFDYRVEKVGESWLTGMLPRRESRFGHEARCEVVSCEVWEKIRPGHGPK